MQISSLSIGARVDGSERNLSRMQGRKNSNRNREGMEQGGSGPLSGSVMKCPQFPFLFEGTGRH
jgi:hypothetical protein